MFTKSLPGFFGGRYGAADLWPLITRPVRPAGLIGARTAAGALLYLTFEACLLVR